MGSSLLAGGVSPGRGMSSTLARIIVSRQLVFHDLSASGAGDLCERLRRSGHLLAEDRKANQREILKADHEDREQEAGSFDSPKSMSAATRVEKNGRGGQGQANFDWLL